LTVLPAAFVLPLDKPEGPTSHDVVRAARKSLGERRIGHTGTLDPFASGLMLLCVGKATRLAEYLGGLEKTYRAVALLGQTTDTLDREGSVREVRGGWEALDRARVEKVLARFVGEMEQVAPVYSAKKVGGVPAHRRVRRGEAVELAPARVTIHALDLLCLDLPRVELAVRCSTGTYVRALARDIGEALGVGAHLVSLRRTAIGSFTVERALSLGALGDPSAVAAAVLAPLEALAHLPALDVDAAAASKLAHGGTVPLECDEGAPSGPIVVSHAGALLAIGEWVGGALRPRKVLAE
jgi:tRNA pseudouridine55 synthase